MKLNRLFMFLAAALLIFPSCNSSKIAYGNSYYFKAKPKALVQKVPPVNAVRFYASTGEVAMEHPEALERVKVITSPEIRIEEPPVQTKLTKTQKKEFRQQIKAEKKALKKEIKDMVRSTKSTAAPSEMEGLVKAGIIVGAAGAVMLLIGVLASGAFLTTLGGIFLAVGLVLILLRIL